MKANRMTSDFEREAAGFHGEAESVMGETFSLSGHSGSFRGVFDEINQERARELPHVLEEVTDEVVCRRGQFDSAPKAGSRLTRNDGSSYNVEQVYTDEVSHRLFLRRIGKIGSVFDGI